MVNSFDDVYFHALVRLAPGFRHDVLGRLNSTVLNLEVARRALAKGQSERAETALDRAREEALQLSSELPQLLAWWDVQREAGVPVSGLLEHVEILLGPMLRRDGIEPLQIDCRDEVAEHELTSQACRELLVVLVEACVRLAGAVGEHRTIELRAVASDDGPVLLVRTSPRIEAGIEQSPLEVIAEREGFFSEDDEGWRLRLAA